MTIAHVWLFCTLALSLGLFPAVSIFVYNHFDSIAANFAQQLYLRKNAAIAMHKAAQSFRPEVSRAQ